MKTRLIPSVFLVVLFVLACSKQQSAETRTDLPFAPPSGWQQDDDKSKGLVYRNPAESKQFFRFILVRFNKPPRLTQAGITEELKSITEQESVTLEKT